ncbi:MAG TPA: flagellar hook-basal body complex protein [Sedimentisphaerales bacterium]|nr:flagellar hook-basal body complex protein [Sedimentisphaerales bacterium]
MAIEGEGFFMLRAGDTPVFTRAGSFAVDAASMLVDPSTGYRVQRMGTVGESDNFQIPGDSNIKVPYDTLLPARATNDIVLSGNLSADPSVPTAAVLSSGIQNRYTVGGAAVSSSTLIRDLDQFSGTLGSGDEIRITGTMRDGSSVDAALGVTDTTTVGDLIAMINSSYTGSTATLNDGLIVLTDDVAGYSRTDINISFSGSASLATPGYFLLTTAGGQATKSVNATIYNALGGKHVMTAALVRTDVPNQWDLVITSVSGEVMSIDDRRIEGITFNQDGGYVGLTGSFDYTFGIRFRHDPTRTQEITASLGTAGRYDGLTQFGGTSTAVITSQDGFESGKLSSLGITNEGVIIGTFTNGQKMEIATMAVGLFRNPGGLETMGKGYYISTGNSGDPVVVQGMSGGAGTIHGGSLERSNVDVANEFVQMIQAQNGFQANARTISVANDILRELSTLIR